MIDVTCKVAIHGVFIPEDEDGRADSCYDRAPSDDEARGPQLVVRAFDPHDEVVLALEELPPGDDPAEETQETRTFVVKGPELIAAVQNALNRVSEDGLPTPQTSIPPPDSVWCQHEDCRCYAPHHNHMD